MLLVRKAEVVFDGWTYFMIHFKAKNGTQEMRKYGITLVEICNRNVAVKQSTSRGR
jgi:hypothetical protein